MKRLVRRALAHVVARMPRGPLIDYENYDLFQSRGLHIRSVDFYSPVPNTAEISPSLWEKPSPMRGVNRNIDQQSTLLKEFSSFLDEYHRLPETSSSPDKYARLGGFGDEDGALLYCMIRKFKPRRIIEIGAGKSTVLSSLALEVNGDPAARLQSIDPFPQAYLKESERLSIQVCRVEDVPHEVFDQLEANDILFIDSSHSVRIGGDVICEIIEILPRLKPGVVIHIHDIFLPFHYPREWVMDRHVCWTEQYLLQAFLAYNNAFKILWGYGMMAAERPNDLRAAFPRPPSFGNGSSLWLVRQA